MMKQLKLLWTLVPSTGFKRQGARLSILVGMTLLWAEVFRYLLGAGPSTLIVAVVFGYGLTDHFIKAAGGKK